MQANQLIAEIVVKDSGSAVADRVSTAMGKLNEGVVTSTRVLETQARSFERLKAAADPLYAAQVKLANAQVQVNNAVKLGIATQAEANAVLSAQAAKVNAAGGGGSFGIGGGVTDVLKGLGIGLGISEIVSFGHEIVRTIGDLSELSKQLGINAEQLQIYQYAARQTSVSQEDLTTGLRHFADQVGQAQAGNKAAVQLFSDLHISLKDNSGAYRDVNSLIADFADRVQHAATQAQALAMEHDALGKSGQVLNGVFKDGSAGIEKYTEDAKAAGIVNNHLIEDFNKASVAFENFKMRLVVDAAEIIDQLAVGIPAAMQKMMATPGFSAKFGMAGAGHMNDNQVDVLAGLEAQRAAMETRLGQLTGGTGGVPSFKQALGKSLQAQINDMDKQIAAAQQALTGSTKPPGAPRGGGAFGTSNPDVVPGATFNYLKPDQGAIDNAKGVTAVLAELQKQLDNLNKSSAAVRASDAFGKLLPSQADLTRAKTIIQTMDDIKAKRAEDMAFEQEIDQLIQQGTNDLKQRQVWLNSGLADQQEQIGLLQKQIDMAGESDAQQQLTLAHLKAESDLHKQFGNQLDDNAKKYLANADAIAAMNVQLAKQKAVSQEIPQFLDQAFQQIGQAVTQLNVAGQSAMVTIKNLGVAILGEIEQELFKLAVINPINNAMGGGNATTIGDLISGLLGMFSGGGGGVVSGGDLGSQTFPISIPGPSAASSRVASMSPHPAGMSPANSNVAPTVNIINNTGTAADAKASTSVGSNGEMRIMVTLEKQLASSVRNGGPLGRAINESIGASRVASVQRS